MRWAVAVLAASEALYMLIDGIRALTVGDYFTPRSGAYAGRLGPWADLVQAVGIAPRGTLMKGVFVAYGSAWIAVTVAYLAGAPWARAAMLAMAVGSLWYLVPGTAISALVIVLLVLSGRPR